MQILQLATQIHHTDQQKAAWIESGFCVNFIHYWQFACEILQMSHTFTPVLWTPLFAVILTVHYGSSPAFECISGEHIYALWDWICPLWFQAQLQMAVPSNSAILYKGIMGDFRHSLGLALGVRFRDTDHPQQGR